MKKTLEMVLVDAIFTSGFNPGMFSTLVDHFVQADKDGLEDPEAIALKFRDKRGDYASQKLDELLLDLDQLIVRRRAAWGTAHLCDRLRIEVFIQRTDELARKLITEQGLVHDAFLDYLDSGVVTIIGEHNMETALWRAKSEENPLLTPLCEHQLHHLAIAIIKIAKEEQLT